MRVRFWEKKDLRCNSRALAISCRAWAAASALRLANCSPSSSPSLPSVPRPLLLRLFPRAELFPCPRADLSPLPPPPRDEPREDPPSLPPAPFFSCEPLTLPDRRRAPTMLPRELAAAPPRLLLLPPPPPPEEEEEGRRPLPSWVGVATLATRGVAEFEFPLLPPGERRLMTLLAAALPAALPVAPKRARVPRAKGTTPTARLVPGLNTSSTPPGERAEKAPGEKGERGSAAALEAALRHRGAAA